VATPRSPMTSPPAAMVSDGGSVVVVVAGTVVVVEVAEVEVVGGRVVDVVAAAVVVVETGFSAPASPPVRNRSAARAAAAIQSPDAASSRVRFVNLLLLRVSWAAMALSIIARPVWREPFAAAGVVNSNDSI
jgi:hypothetical protein